MDNNETPKVALRPIGSLFRETWKLYKERWSVLVEIVLLPTLVVILGTVLIALDLGSIFRLLGGLIVFVGWIAFMYSVLPVIYSVHNTTGVDASYKATIGWFWPYVWVVILQILAFMGASVMLVIPGVWLGVSLAFMGYAFVIEGRRGIDALRQSKDYIKGYWWAVLGRSLLIALVYVVVAMVVQIPVTLIAGKALGGLVSAVMVLFFVPFSVIYNYAMFKNLREIKPELAGVQTKKGGGFIKASAIVGIVVPVLLVILGIFFAAAAGLYMLGHGGNGGNGYAPAGYGSQSDY